MVYFYLINGFIFIYHDLFDPLSMFIFIYHGLFDLITGSFHYQLSHDFTFLEMKQFFAIDLFLEINSHIYSLIDVFWTDPTASGARRANQRRGAPARADRRAFAKVARQIGSRSCHGGESFGADMGKEGGQKAIMWRLCGGKS